MAGRVQLLSVACVVVASTVVAGCGSTNGCHTAEARDADGTRYEATVRVTIGPDPSERSNNTVVGLNVSPDRMAAYARLATSDAVLDGVLDQTGDSSTRDELAREVDVTVEGSALVLDVRASDGDQDTARGRATAVAAGLIDQVNRLEATTGPLPAPIRATVRDKAAVVACG